MAILVYWRVDDVCTFTFTVASWNDLSPNFETPKKTWSQNVPNLCKIGTQILRLWPFRVMVAKKCWSGATLGLPNTIRLYCDQAWQQNLWNVVFFCNARTSSTRRWPDAWWRGKSWAGVNVRGFLEPWLPLMFILACRKPGKIVRKIIELLVYYPGTEN